LTVSDIAGVCGVSECTIYRRLAKSYAEKLPHKHGRDVVVMADATYWGRRFGVVVMKDYIEGYVLWYKFITGKERVADYKEGVEYLESRGLRIQCIVSDGLRGLREMFPQYKFQLCQFHQLMTVRSKLTLRPKLEASQELLELGKTLCRTDKESFIGALDEWHAKWEDFLGERAAGKDGRTHYVHKNTRSANLSLKRNMPSLWTWYDNPGLGIPNTNNAPRGVELGTEGETQPSQGIDGGEKKSANSENNERPPPR